MELQTILADDAAEVSQVKAISGLVCLFASKSAGELAFRGNSFDFVPGSGYKSFCYSRAWTPFCAALNVSCARRYGGCAQHGDVEGKQALVNSSYMLCQLQKFTWPPGVLKQEPKFPQKKSLVPLSSKL